MAGANKVLKEGQVLNNDGEVIGSHKGAFVYTIGQRHGFTINNQTTNSKPLFVISRDIENNTITVGEAKIELDKAEINLENLVLRSPIKKGDEIEAQFRYRQTPFKVKIVKISENNLSFITLDKVEQSAIGQSCVLYRGSHCLGGGIIG